ncbi:MAG: response regulator [Candidatus Bathyarchaeota archaeon]|nr:response regulator [Candidatus Bathyarchaeota archaeon]
MPTAAQPTILIVDDDQTILSSFERIFKRNGYSVDVAEKGKEAIQKIIAQHYDITLIDFQLPDMEGTDLFPIIRHASPSTIKIILTGKIELENVIVGADVFISKPIDPKRLLSIINTKIKDKDIEKPL